MKIIGSWYNPPVVGGPDETIHLVEWRCNIAAKTPEQAMRQALELILEPCSEYRTFTAREPSPPPPRTEGVVVADLSRDSRAAAWVGQALTKLVESDDTRVQVDGEYELRAVKVTGLAVTLTVQDGSDEDTREYIDFDFRSASASLDGSVVVAGWDITGKVVDYTFTAARLTPLSLNGVVPTNP